MSEVQTTLIQDDPAPMKLNVAPKVFYFAVGPNSHEVTCPFCKIQAKTTVKRKYLKCYRQHYCSSCGEYLGTFRRPQL
ncbi:uncharacterized protein LOC129950169 [Eupeodes corollae]|uniref:uncharacterized protein LOC129950169 n=1 Tax=Eupeodes corollae TaxID=290404 RepID=UPI002492860C|nr:uncharacterized protein LOC129950169 [Eupeodes corollae]